MLGGGRRSRGMSGLVTQQHNTISDRREKVADPEKAMPPPEQKHRASVRQHQNQIGGGVRVLRKVMRVQHEGNLLSGCRTSSLMARFPRADTLNEVIRTNWKRNPMLRRRTRGPANSGQGT